MKDFGKDVRFYLLVAGLIHRIRTGWKETHWGITAERLEDIGDHAFLVAILAINLSKKTSLPVNTERVVTMAVLHDIAEVLLGDITPFDGITPEQKKIMEHKAMEMMFENLEDGNKYYALLLEFDEHKTPDAKFAYFCDKLQANLMSKWYQDKGFQNDLANQENNVAFKSSRCQAAVANGAKTAFDVWYACDYSLFEGDPLFTGIMDWIKNNDVTFTDNDPIFTKYKQWLIDNNLSSPYV